MPLFGLFDPFGLFPAGSGGGGVVYTVGGDLSAIESGPCALTYRGQPVGHTLEWVTVLNKPTLRNRFVDEQGEQVVEMVQTGDSAVVKTRVAEKTFDTLAFVYTYADSVDAQTFGFGARIGRRASSRCGELRIHPLEMLDDASQDVVFSRASVTDTGEVQFGSYGSDRVFDVTWTMLIDETKSAGRLLGQIGVPAA